MIFMSRPKSYCMDLNTFILKKKMFKSSFLTFCRQNWELTAFYNAAN